MNEIFLLLSAVPAIEARGASIYFIYTGQIWLVPLTVILNFIAVVLFIKLIEMGRIPNAIENFFERRMNKYHAKVRRWFYKYGNLAIFFLIALPSTGIGSFTGAFIGRAFGLKTRSFYVSVLLGIGLSIIISFPIAYLLNLI